MRVVVPTLPGNRVTSLRFRRLARIFAALLLLWTGADLVDYGVCVHQHGRIGLAGDRAYRTPSSAGDAGHGAREDCFCCSHVVDVRLPFRIDVMYSVAWSLGEQTVLAPDLRTAPLHHPPLG